LEPVLTGDLFEFKPFARERGLQQLAILAIEAKKPPAN
jgi:hypothetical protein